MQNDYQMKSMLARYNLNTKAEQNKAIADMVSKGVSGAQARAMVRNQTGKWNGAK